MRILILLSLILLSENCFAKYNYNSQCRQAYAKIFSLHFISAQKIINAEKNKDPQNLVPILLENNIDFYRAFIGEREVDFEIFEKNADDRLAIINDLGDKDSPYHRFAKAEIILHSAFLNAKFKNFLTAAWAVRKSYKLLEKNAELYPDFPLTYKNLGFLHAALGSVPDKYRWLVKTVGMDGQINQGVLELRKAIKISESNENYKVFKPEILSVLLSVLQ
ncbi:MAG: hypothetical protein HKN22_00715, partial [Bacteroidia bacterium]|nr:hypothetical protein [Bacteroidia bacterium]